MLPFEEANKKKGKERKKKEKQNKSQKYFDSCKKVKIVENDAIAFLSAKKWIRLGRRLSLDLEAFVFKGEKTHWAMITFDNNQNHFNFLSKCF